MFGQTMAARRRIVAFGLGVVGLLAVVGIAVAGPTPPASLSLNLPAANEVVAQNVSGTGCIADPNRGSGFIIDFSWTDPQLKGVHRYELVLQHVGGTGPTLDVIVTGTSFHYATCSFVIPNNESNWYWQVSALNNGHKVLAQSVQRPLSFAPCLVGSTPCSAP